MVRPDMKIIRIAICDDEPIWQERMKEMCRAFLDRGKRLKLMFLRQERN